MQTLALLDQKRLSLKYGIPLYAASIDGAPPPVAADSVPFPAAEKDWDVVSVDSRVTERNDSWWRFAWRLTMRNTGANDRVFNATIQFQDEDGFVIDSDRGYNLILKAGEEKSFTGFSLVRLPGARNVHQTYAKVQEK